MKPKPKYHWLRWEIHRGKGLVETIYKVFRDKIWLADCMDQEHADRLLFVLRMK